jgi:hypothetical protein
MYMIMYVLDDTSSLDKILDAWSVLGVSGATIIESTGLYRRRRQHIPMRYSYGDSPSDETGNSTLFVVVQDEKMVHLCLKAIEDIMGNLDKPNTGVFTAWPLAITKGISSGHNKG